MNNMYMEEYDDDITEEQEIQALEMSIKEAEGLVEMADAVKRLEANPDFLKVIGEQFLRVEAIRMLDMSNDPRMPADNRKCLERDIHAPAALKRFLEATIRAGMAARSAIEEAQENLDELHDAISGAVSFDADEDGEE